MYCLLGMETICPGPAAERGIMPIARMHLGAGDRGPEQSNPTVNEVLGVGGRPGENGEPREVGVVCEKDSERLATERESELSNGGNDVGR